MLRRKSEDVGSAKGSDSWHADLCPCYRGFKQDMDYLTGYRPLLERVNILLCGGVGAGKSSFINSLLTVFHSTKVHAASVAQHASTVTRHVTKYRLESIRDDLPGFLTTCIDLWDTPGFTYEQDATTYRGGQLAHMVEGNIPDQFPNLDTTGITFNTPGLQRDPTPSDKMHVVLLMVNYKHLNERDSPYMARVNEFIAQMRNPSSAFTQSTPRASHTLRPLSLSPALSPPMLSLVVSKLIVKCCSRILLCRPSAHHPRQPGRPAGPADQPGQKPALLIGPCYGVQTPRIAEDGHPGRSCAAGKVHPQCRSIIYCCRLYVCPVCRNCTDL